MSKLLDIFRLKKKKKKKFAQNGIGSITIGIPKCFLNSVSPFVKWHFVRRYETTLIRVASVKYLFPRDLDIQYRDKVKVIIKLEDEIVLGFFLAYILLDVLIIGN